jgi:tetratricopeptide (TPR) repeat protein
MDDDVYRGQDMPQSHAFTPRFNVGDRVQCMTGRMDFMPGAPPIMTRGVVVAHWYRERNWLPGRAAPYQVRCRSGDLIFAPADTDDIISRDWTDAHPGMEGTGGSMTAAFLNQMGGGMGMGAAADSPAADAQHDSEEDDEDSEEDDEDGEEDDEDGEQWGPSEIRCSESGWYGHPARRLFIAQRDSNVDELRRLVAEPTLRAQLNSLDGDTFGLLHLIAMRSANERQTVSADLIDVLVGAGADVDIRNRMGETPLIISAMYGNVQAFERLLHHGARTDRTDAYGNTALAKLKGRPSPFGRITEAERSRLVAVFEATETRQAGAVPEEGASVMDGLEDRVSRATRLREEGNRAFGRGDFAAAQQLYTESLDAREDHRTYCNRAACSLKQGLAIYRSSPVGFDMVSPDIQRTYHSAVSDAQKAIALKPDFAKAYFRQAKGYIGARDLPRARLFLERGLKVCPAAERAPLQQLCDELIAIGIDDEEVAVANAMSGASAEAWNAVRHGAPCTTCPFCIQPVPTGPAMHRSTRTGKPFCPHCAADPTRTVDMKRIEALIIKC